MERSESITDLVGRMARASAAVKDQKPEGKNTHQHYAYYTIQQFMREARNVLSGAGVAIFPNVAEVVEYPQVGKQFRVVVRLDVMFTAAESGEFITTKWYGEGLDSSDKAYTKAYTAALKQCLQKTLLLGGDVDPDGETIEREAYRPRQTARNESNGRTRPNAGPSRQNSNQAQTAKPKTPEKTEPAPEESPDEESKRFDKAFAVVSDIVADEDVDRLKEAISKNLDTPFENISADRMQNIANKILAVDEPDRYDTLRRYIDRYAPTDEEF